VKADYDQAFKILVDLNPNDWALLAGLTVVDNAAEMETELPERNRHLDRLIRVSDDQGDIAVHLEFQAGKSGNRVPIRLIDYSIGVTEKYRLPVHSCVVLLRRPADSPVLTGAYKPRSRGVMPYLTFRYRVVRLWQVPVNTLLLPGSSVAVAAVLADHGTLPADEIAEQIAACINVISDIDTRAMLFTIAYNLAGLRFNDSQADIMFGRDISVLEKYSSTVQATLRRGEARLLLTSAEQIFGAPSQEILDKVRSAKSKKLVEWTVRIRTAQSWAELVTD
jgi:hypothetical protein